MSRYKERPCPGCGKMFNHDGSHLCAQCRVDLERGKEQREKYAEHLRNASIVVFSWGNRYLYDVPFVRNTDYKIRDTGTAALWRLLDPESASAYGVITHKLYEGYDGNTIGALPVWKLVLFRQILDWINHELGHEYTRGFEHGRQWLAKLASGEMSIQEMNETEKKIK